MSVASALKTFADEQTELSFKKAFFEVMHTRWQSCPNCSGEGVIGRNDGEEVRNCPMCNGTGEIEVREDEGLEVFK